jgi:hypothetical protein
MSYNFESRCRRVLQLPTFLSWCHMTTFQNNFQLRGKIILQINHGEELFDNYFKSQYLCMFLACIFMKI